MVGKQGFAGKEVGMRGRFESHEPVKWTGVVACSVWPVAPGFALGGRQMVAPSARIGAAGGRAGTEDKIASSTLERTLLRPPRHLQGRHMTYRQKCYPGART